MALSKRAMAALSKLLDAQTVRDDEAFACGRTPVSVEEFLPGGTVRGRHGEIYVHEKLRSEIEGNTPRLVSRYRRAELAALTADLAGRAEELGRLGKIGFSKVVFLDIETTGFFSCPTFLVGTMSLSGNDFVIRQFFARNYSEEKCLIHIFSKYLAQFDAIVTFNGKAFDMPFIADRALYHGVRAAKGRLARLFHFDILHHSRRHWRGTLPDCRLQTLELHVCRRRRVGDVPGSEIPRVYHDYVRTGDPYLLVRVFHHNVLDLITMSEILVELMTLDGLIKRRRSRHETLATKRPWQ
jgi:uncharacterized protein YprB with RNaseH-like and TPR domain